MTLDHSTDFLYGRVVALEHRRMKRGAERAKTPNIFEWGADPPQYYLLGLQSQVQPPSLSLENILLKAANGEVYEEDFQMAKCSYYEDDINFDHLQKQCTDLF